MSIFYPLKVKNVRRETNQCVSISFDVPTALESAFAFEAGQYLTLRADVNGAELRRSYSLCSAPHSGEWRVAIKKVLDGAFSTFANAQIKVGDTIDVMPPNGNFKLPTEQVAHYVFFAAGSGITPIVSMLKTVLATQPNSRCTLIYGNQNAANVIFREEIEGLKNKNLGRLRIFHVLSRERVDADISFGRLDAPKMAQLFEKIPDILGGGHFFICGPLDMTQSIQQSLEKAGIAPNQIHFELFGVPKKQKKGIPISKNNNEELTKNVTIALDGLSFDIKNPVGMNILDAAQAYGADIPYACKGGVCCTCRAKLVSGEVEMEVNYALSESEVEAGFILTCQAVPISDDCVVSFDIK